MNARLLTIFLIALTLSAVGEAWYIVHQQNQIGGLNFRILSLQYQNSVLSSRCSVLESNMSEVLGELEDQIEVLQSEYDQLKEDHEALQLDHNLLEHDFKKLRLSKREIWDQLGNYTAQFKQLKETVNHRLALDGNLSRFVTPHDNAVIDAMLDITAGHEDPDSLDEYWEDIWTLYDWITETISYGADSPYPYLYSDPSYPVRWFEHSVRYPNETLSDRTGDCEDQAILLLSLSIAHSEQNAKWCISLKWEGGGHVGVAIPATGGEIAILDPAGGYFSGTGLDFSSQPIEEAIEEWIDRLDSHDVQVNSVFNDKLFIEFTSTREFLDWFSSNYG